MNKSKVVDRFVVELNGNHLLFKEGGRVVIDKKCRNQHTAAALYNVISESDYQVILSRLLAKQQDK